MFGKFNIADALRQYGINPCTIVEGRNADAQFPFSDWNKEQLRQVNHLVDHIYTGFIQKVLLILPGAISLLTCGTFSGSHLSPASSLARQAMAHHRACGSKHSGAGAAVAEVTK